MTIKKTTLCNISFRRQCTEEAIIVLRHIKFLTVTKTQLGCIVKCIHINFERFSLDQSAEEEASATASNQPFIDYPSLLLPLFSAVIIKPNRINQTKKQTKAKTKLSSNEITLLEWRTSLWRILSQDIYGHFWNKTHLKQLNTFFLSNFRCKNTIQTKKKIINNQLKVSTQNFNCQMCKIYV